MFVDPSQTEIIREVVLPIQLHEFSLNGVDNEIITVGGEQSVRPDLQV